MKLQYSTFLSLCMLASCSSEFTDDAKLVANGDIDKVILRSQPFEYEGDTRTILTPTDTKIVFSWADHDAIGVFPVTPTTNSQAMQELRVPVGSDNDASFATFDGAGWDLKSGNTYAAYSPYNGELKSSTRYRAVPVDMTGQDGTLETIGKKYDIMYAPSSDKVETTANGTRQIVFDFQHAVAIVQLKLTMPVAAKWESVTLTNNDGRKVWKTSATVNVSNGKAPATTSSPNISLTLKDVVTTDNNKVLTLYLATFPITTGELTLTATTDEGDKYTAQLKSKKLLAGKAYRWVANVSPVFKCDGFENGHAYVDLGLLSGLKWATMNVGATGSEDNGNCYAWGETEPRPSGVYDVSSYKWCNGTEKSLTKYCTDSSCGTVDGKTILEADDDAANQNWGGAWRMPTGKEQTLLRYGCYWVWTNNYLGTSTAGFVVYKAKSSTDRAQVVYSGGTPSSNYSLSDSHIFLPAGAYWSSSLYEWSEMALDMFLDSDRCNSENNVLRYWGCSVRAVCE